jgi:hypothetical protein
MVLSVVKWPKNPTAGRESPVMSRVPTPAVGNYSSDPLSTFSRGQLVHPQSCSRREQLRVPGDRPPPSCAFFAQHGSSVVFGVEPACQRLVLADFLERPAPRCAPASGWCLCMEGLGRSCLKHKLLQPRTSDFPCSEIVRASLGKSARRRSADTRAVGRLGVGRFSAVRI